MFDGSITGPKRDAVVLNAAGALVVGDKARDFAEGVKLASEIISSGKAKAKLEELIARSNSFGE